VGYLGEQIQNYVGDGSAFGLTVAYSYDGDQLLGTGGAIRKALPLLDGPFFVLYGDSYLDCGYSDVVRGFATSGRRGLMTIHCNNGKYDTSNVQAVDGIILRYDKRNVTPEMKYIDYGLGVFQPSVFEEIQPNETIDLASVYTKLLEKGELASYEVQNRFYEIGSSQGIRDLEQYLSNPREKFTIAREASAAVKE